MQNRDLGFLLNVLFKWKKFILFIFIFSAALSTLIAFLIKPEYKAKAVVMTPPESSSPLSGLSGLIGGKSTANIGAKLFGVSSTDIDILLGILNSRASMIKASEKFNLFEYYEIKDKNYDKLLKKFSKDVSFEPNQYDFIEISVINEDPKLAADIANFFVEILDSINIKLNSEAARNNRIFIEKRYLKNLQDLKEAEEKMYEFQKKNKIFAVPEQLQIAVKIAGEIESQLIIKEIELDIARETYGLNSPQYTSIEKQTKLLRQRVQDLKNKQNISDVSNVLFPFSKMPQVLIEYYRLYREIEIQNKIMEILLPMYEQAKVEEQKSIPTVIVLDKAVPPQLKYKPKRTFIVAGVSILFLFISLFIAFILEHFISIDATYDYQKRFKEFALKAQKKLT